MLAFILCPFRRASTSPFFFLQKVVECFEYSCLLDQAAECTSREQTLEQMVFLLGFDLASYGTVEGGFKPFSPLLNETYECDRADDLGWRFVSEYYSHFPPKFVAVKKDPLLFNPLSSAIRF